MIRGMPRMLPRLFLAAGLGAVLVSARPRIAAPPSPPEVTTGPTFSKEVVRIFQQHCQSCHHPGDIGPFSMMTYADTRLHAADIKLMTASKRMPPWKPTAGCGDFTDADARTLTDAEIATIGQWVDGGAREGNRADLPTSIDFSGGWSLGQPDLVLKNPNAYQPPANGDMYRCYTMPANTTADQYVSAIDVHPGDRGSVHHVIAYLDTTGESVKLDEADPQPGYQCFGGPGFSISNPAAATLGGWAPGARPTFLPDGVALSLPANARVVLQVHYHSHDGHPLADQTEIGIYYAKQKPAKLLRILPLINQSFTIPPNSSKYEVTAALPIQMPFATHLVFVSPHMHLLGRTMSVQAALPGKASACLIDIADWDFNWQGMYRYKNPIALPAGTALVAKATYDNSVDNPRNPNDPPQAVSWGEATTDEMCIAFLGITIDAENLITGQKVDDSALPR
jgi:hypothetical protein